MKGQTPGLASEAENRPIERGAIMKLTRRFPAAVY